MEDLDDTGFFEFVDSTGNLTNSSHFLTYGLMACFCLTTGLICCFHNQLKACCSICIPAKEFTPSINYNVSDERIVVGEQEIIPGKNLSNPYENHSQNTS